MLMIRAMQMTGPNHLEQIMIGNHDDANSRGNEKLIDPNEEGGDGVNIDVAENDTNEVNVSVETTTIHETKVIETILANHTWTKLENAKFVENVIIDQIYLSVYYRTIHSME